MEARSLLAICALFLVLWLVRTWFYWDSQERMAQRSRDRLKNKLSATPLIERVRVSKADSALQQSESGDSATPAVSTSPVSAAQMDVDTSSESRVTSAESSYSSRSAASFTADSAANSDDPEKRSNQDAEFESQQRKIDELSATVLRRDDTIRTLQSKLEETEKRVGAQGTQGVQSSSPDQGSERNTAGNEHSAVAKGLSGEQATADASVIKELEERIEERDRQLQRQEHAFQEIEKLRKTLFERNRDIEVLQQKITKNDSALEQYRNRAQKAAMLEQQLTETTRLVEQREQEIARLQQAATGSAAHSDEAGERAVSDQKAGATASAADGDRKTLERLNKALAESEAAAEAAQQSDLELRRLRGELESLQSRNSLSAARINDLEKRITERRQEMSEARADEAVSTDQIANLKKELGEKEQANQLLQRQIEELKQSRSGDSSAQAHSDAVEGARHAAQPAAQHASDEHFSLQHKPALSADTASADQGQQRPKRLFSTPDEKDDLKLIKGIGPVMERTLNDLGVQTFRQLANFSKDDIDRVSAAINTFPGRIERDNWVGKAQKHYREKYGEEA